MTASDSGSKVIWGNPGALGLACFGFNTLLLNIHNIGLIDNTIPLIWGFFWGGTAQIIAGVIEARRGETFAFTAFVAYGFFWVGLGSSFLLQWLGIVTLDAEGLAWTMILWGIFSLIMTFGSLKISNVHVTIFVTLTILFGLLAAHFYGALPLVVAGAEGIFVGAAAIYLSAAIMINATYGRWILPIGHRK
jgi:succinate-acetate transporter protein